LNEISSSYYFRLKAPRVSSKMDYIAVYEDVEQLASIEPEEFNRKRLRLRLLKCCLFSLVVEKGTSSSEEGCLIKTNDQQWFQKCSKFPGSLDRY
jgi:hypothetical protein